MQYILFFVALLLALIVVGTPIAWSLLITGGVGLLYVIGLERAMGIFITTTYGQVSVYLFSTIPMFILMAEFLSRSKISENVYEAIYVWTNNIKGGLAMATTLANGGMAALSGSSTASAATMARIAVPEMQKYGYDDRLSMGTVSAAGTFAIMLPPSLGLILFGIITETSISRLFIGGVVPGLLTIAGYIAVIYLWGVWNPTVLGRASEEQFSMNERITVLKPIYPAIILIMLVLGGLYSGAITPTEAGAIGASGAFVIAIIFSDLRMVETNEALGGTLRVTTMIFMILIGAMVFGRFLVVTGVTPYLVQTVGDAQIGRWGVLMLLLVVYILMGTLMNQSAILILTLPVTFPIVVDGLGFHPIWFGVVLVKTAEIGMVTPPLGLNVYVASGAIEDIDINTTFKGAMRFLLADFFVLGIMMMFPRTVLWLPKTMG